MIITKTGTVLKGVPNQFTLDIDELAALVTAPEDAYYADITHWHKVTVNYVSTTGNQTETMYFNPAIDPCVKAFLVSDFAFDSFEVRDVVITDFDNGTHIIPRAALPVEEFDVTFESPYLSFDNNENAAILIPTGDSLTYSTYDGNTANGLGAIDNTSLGSDNDDLDVSFTFAGFDWSSGSAAHHVFCGFTSDLADYSPQGPQAFFVQALANGVFRMYEANSVTDNGSWTPVSGFVIRITQSSTEIKVYLDGVLKFTKPSNAVFLTNLYPFVRMVANGTLTNGMAS